MSIGRNNTRGSSLYLQPVIEVVYVARGHDYLLRAQVGAPVRLTRKRGGLMEEAQSQLAAFPVGGDIDVEYRPDNPGAAAVEGGATSAAGKPDGSYRAGVALMLGASFAVAAYVLGLF